MMNFGLKLRRYDGKDLNRHLELLLMNGVYAKITDKIAAREKGWLKRVVSNYKKRNPDLYALAITLNGTLIGNLIAEKIDYRNKTLEIGFWIGKDFWSKGYATKALKLFLKKLKSEFNPRKVIARYKTENIASGRVLEKAGFTLEGESKGMKNYRRFF